MTTKFKLNVLFVLLSFLMVACTQESFEQQDMAIEQAATEEEMFEETEEQQSEEEVGIDLGDKIIENASLSYETTNFDAALEFVSEQIPAHEGLLEHSNRGQGNVNQSEAGDYIAMSIRIPQEQLHPFIDAIDSYKDLYLLTQEIGRQDVTQEYRDNETRMAVLEEEEAALRELLQEQGSLEEILQVRKRLSEVISEREMFENQNQAFDEQVAYSTVDLSIQQTDRASEQDVSGFWNRLTNAFVDSFYSFISFTQNLIIGFIYFIPHVIVLSILSYVIYRIWQSRKENGNNL